MRTMTQEIPAYTKKVLGQFAESEWHKVLAYLQRQFSMSADDCKDVFQEAFITLYKQNLEGRLNELSSSLSTYFISVCRNKAFEKLRAEGRQAPVAEELAFYVRLHVTMLLSGNRLKGIGTEIVRES